MKARKDTLKKLVEPPSDSLMRTAGQVYGFIDGETSRLPDEILRILKDALTPSADIGTIVLSGIKPDIRNSPAPEYGIDSCEFHTFRKIPGPVPAVKYQVIPAIFCR